MTSLAFTSDFATAFEKQTTRLLRDRFLWFTGIFALISIVWLVASVVVYTTMFMVVSEGAANASGGGARSWYVSFVQHGLDALLYGIVFVQAWRRPISDARLVMLTGAMILFDGLATLLLDAASGEWGVLSIWSLLIPHLLACIFLPWNLWQSVRPMLPVMVLNLMLLLIWALLFSTKWGWPSIGMAIFMTVLMPMPGVVVAAIKHDSRVRAFRVQFLESRYGQVRREYGQVSRELADARKIHESLFPRAEARGSVRFDYRYQPMRSIGGDYLYARFDHSKDNAEPALTVLLMDVTGHGVAAALTVNRLYGEVERLFGENPDILPGEVVRALNRYVYHTLANHALYVTAACIKVEPAHDRVLYANAGHPPAFVRGVDGTIEQLDSTTFLLGAVHDDDFDGSHREVKFVRGDMLLMYTDGAMEAADAERRQFGITGLQRAIASCGNLGPGDWSAMLLSAVDRHRTGPPEDDTLVVEISRLIVPARGLEPGEKRVTVVHE